MTAVRVTGKPVRRVEDGRFLTGQGSYVDDVSPKDWCTSRSRGRHLRAPA